MKYVEEIDINGDILRRILFGMIYRYHGSTKADFAIMEERSKTYRRVNSTARRAINQQLDTIEENVILSAGGE